MGKDLRTIAQLVRGTLYTESQIRGWVREAGSNGLGTAAVERIGSRILVDADAFYKWRAQVEKRRAPTFVADTMGLPL